MKEAVSKLQILVLCHIERSRNVLIMNYIRFFDCAQNDIKIGFETASFLFLQHER